MHLITFITRNLKNERLSTSWSEMCCPFSQKVPVGHGSYRIMTQNTTTNMQEYLRIKRWTVLGSDLNPAAHMWKEQKLSVQANLTQLEQFGHKECTRIHVDRCSKCVAKITWLRWMHQYAVQQNIKLSLQDWIN